MKYFQSRVDNCFYSQLVLFFNKRGVLSEMLTKYCLSCWKPADCDVPENKVSLCDTASLCSSYALRCLRGAESDETICMLRRRKREASPY